MKDELVPARNKYFSALEQFLATSESGYLVGKTPTWADIVISDNLETLCGLAPGLFDGHPKIKKFIDHVNQLPNIMKYKSARPPSKF